MRIKSEIISEKDNTLYIPVSFKNTIGCYKYTDFLSETDEIRINYFNYKLKFMKKNILVKENGCNDLAMLDKYDLHKIISEIEELKPYIPPTEMFHNFKGMVKFIEENKKVILKPVDILSNEEICIIEKTDYGFKIEDKKSENNIGNILLTSDEFKRYIEKEGKRFQSYIIQKYIKRARIEQSIYDIRTIMCKRGRVWKLSEIECKVGRNNFVFTNKPAEEKFISLNKVLKNSLPIGCSYDTIMDEIERVDTIICNTLDDFNDEFLEVIVDISIDKDRKLWITEINILSYFRGFKLIDYKIYRSLKYSLLLYGVNK